MAISKAWRKHKREQRLAAMPAHDLELTASQLLKTVKAERPCGKEEVWQ